MTGTHAAMVVRSRMIRHRPWISDGVWIAHESHQLFGRIAALMPTNGWWRMDEAGALALADGPPIDLSEFIATTLAASAPCVVHHDAYERSEDFGAAIEHIDEQIVEVVDQDGALWAFSQDVIEAAVVGHADWSWRIAPAPTTGRLLVAVDRKGRARFVLASLTPTEDPS